MAKCPKHLRRIAIQLAAQLPADTTEARAVLSLCSDFVDNFLDDEDEKPALRLVCAEGIDEAG